MMEVDFGSAPVAALEELIATLSTCGATAMRLGISDGTEIGRHYIEILQNGQFTAENLAGILAELLENEASVGSIQVRGSTLEVVTENGNSSRLHTDNLFACLRRLPAEASVKEFWAFLRGQREFLYRTIHPLTHDLSELRPTIKDVRFFRDNGLNCERMVSRPLVADLFLCCVWDSPSGMQYVVADEPEKYGMTAATFLERAVKNYVACRPRPEYTEQDGFLLLRTGDCYEASLLVDDDLWIDTATRVEGDIVACAPARDFLLVCGSRNQRGIRNLRAAAGRISAGGNHPISETILIRRKGAWEPFLEPASAPTRPQSQGRSPARRDSWWRFWSR